MNGRDADDARGKEVTARWEGALSWHTPQAIRLSRRHADRPWGERGRPHLRRRRRHRVRRFVFRLLLAALVGVLGWAFWRVHREKGGAMEQPPEMPFEGSQEWMPPRR
jgi:hypothetical protein